jgi:hypothetical protein
VIKNEISKKNEHILICSDKDRFKIKIVPVRNDICKVQIRVNFMGDKPYGELFYKTIDEEINSVFFK